MINIVLENIGVAFDEKFIFKQLNHTFEANKHWIIQGKNGSGKSTLIKVISTYLIPDEGNIKFFDQHNSLIPTQNIVKQLAIVSPYIDFFPTFTIAENFHFYKTFVPIKASFDLENVFKQLNWQNFLHKKYASLSSGQQQRCKLLFAFASNTSILLFDEPTTHLDMEGVLWYKDFLTQYTQNQTVIIATNNNPNDFLSDAYTLSLD